MKEIRRAIQILEWNNNPVQFFKDISNLEPTKGQKEIMNTLNTKENRVLICCPSGVGKTRCLSLAALYLAFVSPFIKKEPIRVLIISGSLEQSKTLYDYMTEYLRHPFIKDYLQDRLKTETHFKHGSVIKAIPCSEKAYYGKHVNFLIIDEAALKDLPPVLIDHALSIIAPIKDAKLILSSTPYDADSKFVMMWNDKENFPNWKRISWNFNDCHWIPNKEKAIEEARKTLPTEEFEIRWLGKPVPKSDRLIDREALKKCIVEDKIRLSTGPVVFGIDWGAVRNPTIVIGVQYENEHCNILFTKEYLRKFADYIHDNIESLARKYKPRVIYADASHHWENQRLVDRGLPVVEVNFTKEKTKMVSNLISMIEHNKLRINENEINLIAQLRDYREGLKRYDDYVDSLMLSLKENIRPTPSLIIEKVTY